MVELPREIPTRFILDDCLSRCDLTSFDDDPVLDRHLYTCQEAHPQLKSHPTFSGPWIFIRNRLETQRATINNSVYYEDSVVFRDMKGLAGEDRDKSLEMHLGQEPSREGSSDKCCRYFQDWKMGTLLE